MLPFTNQYESRLAALLPEIVSNLLRNDEITAHHDFFDGGYNRAVVLIVDGLGWHNLTQRRGHARNLLSLESGSMKTVVPTTTAAALTSFSTGTEPAEHGLVGYRQKHQSLGILTNLSDWQEISDVRDWQLKDTVFERFLNSGLKSHVIARQNHAGSGFSRATLTGANYHGADSQEAKFQLARELLRDKNNNLIYIYVDDLDRIGHRSGWQSDLWTAELEDLDAEVGRFVSDLSGDTLFVLTADHGMIDTTKADQIFLDEILETRLDGLLIGGEPRFRYLYSDSSKQLAECKNILVGSEIGTILTKLEALELGFFAGASLPVQDRIGDLILLPKDKLVVFGSASNYNEGQSLVGHHGGLSEFEREIPLLANLALKNI